MAFFKLRKAGGEPAAPAPAHESVDALRKRARYRLAGAAILVLAGVIGFPLLFDNQPRPIAVDIPIDIPDKAKARPLVVAPESEPKALAASAPAEPVVPVTVPIVVTSRAVTGQLDAGGAKSPESKAQPKDAQKEEVIISSSKSAAKPASTKSEEKVAANPEAKVEAKPTDKKTDKPAEVTGRFVVQFGAFTDSAHAHEARLTVEKTGLKTYAQIAETPDGKKFRVRVGPFEKRSDAEKAAEKIKKIGLPAAILGL
jgi:DedD protein